MVLSSDLDLGAVLKSRYAWRRSTRERMQDVEWASSRLLVSATDELLICCANGRSAVKVPLPI